MKAATILVLVFAVVAGGAGAVLYQVFASPQAPALSGAGQPGQADLDRETARANELAAQVESLQADLALERQLYEELQARLRDAEETAAREAAADPAAGAAAEDTTAGDAPAGDETGPRQWRGGRGNWNEELTEEQVLAMLSSDNRFERMQALRNLDKLTDRSRAIAVALAELENAEGRDRFMAIDALIRIGGPEAAAALTKILPEEDGWAQVRIARALADMGETSALPVLQTAFASSSDREQVSLAIAMRDLGDTSAVGQVSRVAIGQLSSEDGSMREDAVRTIGSLEDPALNVHLVGALTDSNSDVRMSALMALARQGTSSELGAVMGLTSDPNPQVARVAQRTVEMIQDPTLRERQSQRGFGGPGGGGFGGFGGGGRGGR